VPIREQGRVFFLKEKIGACPPIIAATLTSVPVEEAAHTSARAVLATPPMAVIKLFASTPPNAKTTNLNSSVIQPNMGIKPLDCSRILTT